jgi:hypothetical protein
MSEGAKRRRKERRSLVRRPKGRIGNRPSLEAAACRHHLPLYKELRLGASEELFGKAAEKDRFATANPSCGGLPPCAPQMKPIPPSAEVGQR